MKVKARDVLDYLHAFNMLDSRRVDIVSELFGIDATDICNAYGITYDIVDDPTVKLTKHCTMCETETEHRIIHACMICDKNA